MRTSIQSAGQMAGGDSKSYRGRQRNPQTTAWVVLAVAFAAFWVALIGASWGAKHYYDTDTVPRNATLSLQGGIVLFRDAVTSTLVNASEGMELREGDEVLVDQGARASLTLFDGTRIQLYSGSVLALTQLRQSRFHTAFSLAKVRLNSGTARVDVAAPFAEDGRTVVDTPHGSAVLAIGDYGLEVVGAQTRLSSRAGYASISGKGGTAGLKAGEKIVLSGDAIAGPTAEGDALIRNSGFSQGFSEWDPIDRNEEGRPTEPGQRTLVPEKVGGHDDIALRVQRLSPRGIHGETGLMQVISKDVSDYQSLALRANVKVTGQSLSGGGYMGYEYPVMIRVRYRDASGGQIDWSHGFFTTNPEGRPTPGGEEVPGGEWVSYNCDLMKVSPKPVYLISVEVLGSGHTYDGSIANLDLVGK